MLYQDIDWNKLWGAARRGKSWKSKTSKEWDERARGFAERNIDSVYIDKFITLIKPAADWTVLDIGSGPGTLAVPLSRIVTKITAVDFSSAMIEELQQRIKTEKLTNIDTVISSWADNWSYFGIKPHDVVIASRSLAVDDLKASLTKLNDWAKKTVFISDRVGAGPFDPDIFKAIGREFTPGPDYIYTVNLLYQMGINAYVDFITIDRIKTYQTPQKVVESCKWMIHNMTVREEKNLEVYIKDNLIKINNDKWQLQRSVSPKWAVIWWNTGN